MDDNGLLYLRARYYNPAAGVFTALDPFEGMWNEPMSINGYGYVHGNPVNMTDPSGQIPVPLAAPIIPTVVTVVTTIIGIVSSPVVIGAAVVIGGALLLAHYLNNGCCTKTDVKESAEELAADYVEEYEEYLKNNPENNPGPFVPPLNNPQPQPQSTQQPTPQPTATPTPCDPKAFSAWWTALPDFTGTASAESNPQAAQWENSIARNSVDTFPGQFPKRINIPGAIASGLGYDTLDADGANRNTCRLVDAKYATSSYLSGYQTLTFMLASDHPNIDLLKRYRYAINSTPAVGLEVRINRSDNEAYWIAALGVAGFTYNQDGFVYVYPSANYQP